MTFIKATQTLATADNVNWHQTQTQFFKNFGLHLQIWKKAKTLPEWTQHFRSVATSGMYIGSFKKWSSQASNNKWSIILSTMVLVLYVLCFNLSYATVVIRKWLRIHLAWCGLNKTLDLSLNWHRHSSVANMFTSAVQVVYGLAITLATFVLVEVVAHFDSWDQFLFTFFKSFQTFLLRFIV